MQGGLQDWVWDVVQGRAWQQEDQVLDKVPYMEGPAWDTGQLRADQVVDHRKMVGVAHGVAQD